MQQLDPVELDACLRGMPHLELNPLPPKRDWASIPTWPTGWVASGKCTSPARCVRYLALPKSGSTSIRSALRSRQSITAASGSWRDALAFTFVASPLARLHSAWRFSQSGRQGRTECTKLASFDDWLIEWLTALRLMRRGVRVAAAASSWAVRLAFDPHYRLQLAYLQNAEHEAAMQNRSSTFDFVGRLTKQHARRDWAELVAMAAARRVSLPAKLPKERLGRLFPPELSNISAGTRRQVCEALELEHRCLGIPLADCLGDIGGGSRRPHAQDADAPNSEHIVEHSARLAAASAWQLHGCPAARDRAVEQTARDEAGSICARADQLAAVRCCLKNSAAAHECHTGKCESVCSELGTLAGSAITAARPRVTLAQAHTTCHVRGRRLCTRAELRGGDCCRKGCDMDHSIWCGRVMCALSVDGDTRKEGSTKAER